MTTSSASEATKVVRAGTTVQDNDQRPRPDAAGEQSNPVEFDEHGQRLRDGVTKG